MKKRAKIFLFTAIGVLVLVAAGVIIGFSVKNAKGDTSGCMIEKNVPNEDGNMPYVEGTGKFDWKKYETNIPYGTGGFGDVFTSNEGDTIYDIKFVRDSKYIINDDDERILVFTTNISFETSFNIFDSLDVVLVFSNGFRTDIIHSWTPLGRKRWVILESEAAEAGGNLIGTNIVEVWIRTND